MPPSDPPEPLKLLLVDSDEVSGNALREDLQRVAPGTRITQVASVADALEALRDATPDCAIVEATLPDGSAHTLIKQTKELQLRTPIIVLTGQGDEQLAVKLLKAGASDYLTKANTSSELLLRAVRRARRILHSEDKAAHAEEALRTNRESLATTL